MKTTKRLNIEDKSGSGCYFNDMTNINNFDLKLLLISEFTTFSSRSTMFELNYEKDGNTLYIAFNNIECVFRKSGINTYFVFCESDKNKEMLESYTKIIDGIKDQILFITEDDLFVMGRHFTRFKFNVPVCVISIGNVSEQVWYYPQIFLQECFYENDYQD